ncbi:MAG: glycerate kinase [Candidatus Rifleibacteriota bacterium]
MAEIVLREFCKHLSKQLDAGVLLKKYLKEHRHFNCPDRIIAIGKASLAMLSALDKQMSETRQYFAVSPPGKSLKFKHLKGETFFSAHPLPDRSSFMAGQAIVRFIEKTGKAEKLLIMITGGASSLMIAPAPGLTFDEKVLCHKLLVHSGFSISEINAVRRKISAIKGGKLLYKALSNGLYVSLIAISDVSSGLFHEIGSGPFSPDPTPIRTAIDIAKKIKDFPINAIRCMEHQKRTYTQADFEHEFPDFVRRFTQKIIFDQRAAEQLTLSLLNNLGEPARTIDFDALTDFLFERDSFTEIKPGVWHVSCGENEIAIPVDINPGKGGRASHNLLRAALNLKKKNIGFELAILATDGKDGNSLMAGGWISSDMLAKIDERDLISALENYDSANFLSRQGLSFDAFSTESNVGDIYLFRQSDR